MSFFNIPDSKFWAIVAIGCGSVTVFLVSIWAQNNPNDSIYNSSGFLLVPDWDTNIFPYHVVLMTAGFFISSVIAALSWTFFEDKLNGKIFHIFFQTAAIVSMAIGLIAAVLDKNANNVAHLTTFHAYIGVFCIALYSITYIYGYILGTLPAFASVSLKRMVLLRLTHAMMGEMAMYLTVGSILTGIMNQFGQNGCNYIGITLTSHDVNPSAYFFALPEACKIANGMGILVVLTAMAAMLSTYYRKKPVMKISVMAGKQGDVFDRGAVFTREEVASHNSRDSVWIIRKGRVYDATPFLSSHPGGAAMILNYAGQDCTDEFDSIHSSAAKQALMGLYIGDLAGVDVEPIRLTAPKSRVGNVDARTKRSSARVTDGRLDIELVEQDDDSFTALNPKKFTPFVLSDRTNVSHDTVLLRFSMRHAHQVLGLPVGRHVTVRATIDGELVTRSYTPTSGNLQQGHFDLLVKVYAPNAQHPRGGKMSQHLGYMKVGDSVTMKGPVGHVTYLGRGQLKVGSRTMRVNNFVMVAGGTGITPMYQVTSTTTNLFLLFIL